MRAVLLTGLFVAGMAGAFAVGVFWAVSSSWPKAAYVDLRYALRTSLELEKNWARLPGPASAEGHTAVACPTPADTIVLATGGQSNASNANSTRSETLPGQNVFVWYDGRCFVAKDPILGTAGTGGSLWPELGRLLADQTDRPVLFVNGAVGGSQVGDWLDTRSGYLPAFLTRIEAARAAGFDPDLILWHQGETDAGSPISAVELTIGFKQLTARLLQAVPEDSRLYLFQASKCIGKVRAEGVAWVRDAQAETANANARIILGMNTDTLGNEFRWDTCHFNATGRDRIVTTIAPDILSLID